MTAEATKRILIATPLYPPEIGGPATYARLLEEHLPGHGFDVQVVKFSEVRSLPKLIRHVVFFWKILVGARKADYVLALDPVSVGVPAMAAAAISHKPMILKVVGDYAWEQGVQRFGVKDNLDDFLKQKKHPIAVKVLRLVEAKTARFASRIITPSKYLKSVVVSWGINPAKIQVIYNAFSLDYEPVAKIDLRRLLKLEGVILMSAGRLVPWKGYDDLIGLMPQLIGLVPGIKLYIAGDGPDKVRLEKLIDRKSLRDKVILLGRLDHLALLKYIKAADLFILNTGYEGLSHQLLEVMAVGTPIITTRVGGNPELIEHGRSGLLVEYGDQESLKQAIIDLLADLQEAELLARNAKTKVAEFTDNRLLEETVALVKTI